MSNTPSSSDFFSIGYKIAQLDRVTSRSPEQSLMSSPWTAASN